MQVALPQIMTVFGLDLDQAQWIVTAYVIAGAMVVPAIGWLGNWLGNRTFYVLALSLFVTNSALCALAWSGPSLIAFRILQGLGGGPIAPMTMMFLSSVFPLEQRGMAMGLLGMGQTAGPILGTVIGGYLTEYLGWRMVCFMNVAPGVLSIALVLLVLPNVRDEVQRALDLAGLFTMGVFLVSLLVALSRGQREGWDAPFIQRLFVVAGVALVSFIACELLVKEPLVDLRVYTNRTFAAVSGIIVLFFMTFAASTFLLVILMQRLAGVYAGPGGARPLARLYSPGAELSAGRSCGRPVRPPGHHALRPQHLRVGVVSVDLPQPGVAAQLDRLARGAALQLRRFRLCPDDGGRAVAAPTGEGAHGFRDAEPDAKWLRPYAGARAW